MIDEDAHPYTVGGEGGRFKVRDESNRVIMDSEDENSATHYAVLMNEAYRRGYKAGYRAARDASRKKNNE